MDEKILTYKKYIPYIAVVCLFLIIFLAIYVRTSNIDNLKDVTTGNYTLGPDLDPFLYLRNAKAIIAGTLTNPDMMWAAPLGSTSYARFSLMPWMIVYLYKFLNIFSSFSVEYAAIILPVILFSITLIFFFLFSQKVFSFLMKKEYSYIIAVIATLLYSVIPEMLHRTTAGIPEIESLGMLWFWMAFYFFILAWNSKIVQKKITLGLLAGISTGLMIFSWGGVRYIYMVFSLAVLLSFLLQKVSKKNILVFGCWWLIAIITELMRGSTITGIFSSVSDTLFSSIVMFILLFDLILYEFILKDKKDKIKIPRPLFSIICSAVLLILFAGILFGPSFILDKFSSLTGGILHPFGSGRVGLTVAENRAPYYIELFNSFSVTFLGMQISLFWLFFIGTFLLFYAAINHFNKKDKIILNASFILFLVMSIFSRYSSSSILNGDNFLSQAMYMLSFVILAVGILYVYLKGNDETKNNFIKIHFSYLLLVAFMFFAIISMRGAVRLFFIISPPAILAAAFLPVKLFEYGYKQQDLFKKITCLILVLIAAVMITALVVNYARSSYAETTYTVPGPYQQQWQEAMSWVRTNTPENSIFVHWWDYGYWVQTIGERPTVTDGGHLIEFWDHTTARYLMTAESERTTLQLCKAYNVSYVLFDSTDVGKYGAFASIGSDKTKIDRASWIPTFISDEKQTQELKNETVYVYTGAFYLDQDITWNNELLPQSSAGIPAFLMHVENSQIKAVEAIVIYNNKRYDIPINYIYMNNKKIKLSNDGINAIFYLLPQLTSDGKINLMGASLFLSEKVSTGEFARVYLLGETNMTLVHQEDALIVKQIKQAYNSSIGSDFVLINELYGPIKIFKVPDLSNIPYYTEYLERKSIDENVDPGKLDYLGK